MVINEHKGSEAKNSNCDFDNLVEVKKSKKFLSTFVPLFNSPKKITNMFKPIYPLKALVIVTSPEYDEKLNEFLLACDWESLHKKWNAPREDEEQRERQEKIPVEFMFFEEQPSWRENYRELIDSDEITPELLEENRPFNVLKDYIHKALKLRRVRQPKFIFFPLIPYLADKDALDDIIQEESIDLSSDADLYAQLDAFLAKSLAEYAKQAKKVLRRQQNGFNNISTRHHVANTFRGQEGFIDYSTLTIEGVNIYLEKQIDNLERARSQEEKTLAQIQINIIKERFLSGKLSVGNPMIEISNSDRVMITGHLDASLRINRAKDRTLYFYFLMRALQSQDFISHEEIKETAWEQLKILYKEAEEPGKKDRELSIPDREDFSQTVSRINKRFHDKIAEHLVGSYCITSQRPDSEQPKLYGIQTEPHRIKIHASSSLGFYMKGQGLDHLVS